MNCAMPFNLTYICMVQQKPLRQMYFLEHKPFLHRNLFAYIFSGELTFLRFDHDPFCIYIFESVNLYSSYIFKSVNLYTLYVFKSLKLYNSHIFESLNIYSSYVFKWLKLYSSYVFKWQKLLCSYVFKSMKLSLQMHFDCINIYCIYFLKVKGEENTQNMCCILIKAICFIICVYLHTVIYLVRNISSFSMWGTLDRLFYWPIKANNCFWIAAWK